MRAPYLLSGSYAYDTILDFEGKFQSRIQAETLSKINVCFDIERVGNNFGGCAGNISYNAALLRQKPMLVGTLGRDGQAFKDHLVKQGHDISTLTDVANADTAHAWILSDNQGHQITSFSYGALKAIPEVPTETPEIWLLSPSYPRTIAHLAKLAVEQDKQFFFDPGQALPGFIEGTTDDIMSLTEILRHATGLFVNDSEAELVEKFIGAPLVTLVTRPGQFIVRTRGANGVTLIANGEVQSFPVAKARVVKDPTGCGDAFRAGFLYGYTSGEGLADCVLIGAVMGAFAVECEGGQNHAPTFEEIERAIDDFVDVLGPQRRGVMYRRKNQTAA